MNYDPAMALCLALVPGATLAEPRTAAEVQELKDYAGGEGKFLPL